MCKCPRKAVQSCDFNASTQSPHSKYFFSELFIHICEPFQGPFCVMSPLHDFLWVIILPLSSTVYYAKGDNQSIFLPSYGVTLALQLKLSISRGQSAALSSSCSSLQSHQISFQRSSRLLAVVDLFELRFEGTPLSGSLALACTQIQPDSRCVETLTTGYINELLRYLLIM